MKKVLFVLLILALLFGGYLLYDNYFNQGIPVLNVEESVVNIDELYIYGTHLNMHGNTIDDDNLDLVLYNGSFLIYDINLTNDWFNLSDKINKGIYLDEIPRGNYYVFLRSHNKDENDEDVYKYYTLNNTTKYTETTYYTLSNIGNKIVISNEEETYHTLMLNVSKNQDEVYDVVVDAGHGGRDSGAIKNGYYESYFTMKIASSLKEKLESYGVKVKLTREENQLTKDETMKDYGDHGRAVIPHEMNAKYIFSIHMNSSSSSYVNGLEIYLANNSDYSFAKTLASNIVNKTGINYSSNRIGKKADGIYMRTFTLDNINSSKKEYLDKEMEPYDVTTKSNYYFIIRETGGIMTGAYVDNRNEEIGENPYYDSNVGVESYLLELGYLSNKKDLDNMINNMDKFTDAISESFKTLFVTEE